MILGLAITIAVLIPLAVMCWLACRLPKRTCIYPACSKTGGCLASCTRSEPDEHADNDNWGA